MNLRAAVIGLGEMGQHHLRVLNGLEGVDLVAAVDPRFEGEELYGVVVSRDWEQVTSRQVDMAVVAVPTVLHEAIALDLAQAGVHALVEKPLALSHQSSRGLAGAFASAGLVGCVGHIERYNPALLALRSRLLSGQIGEVFQVATRRQGPYPDRIRDVGVVMDLATHDLDLTAWTTDQPYIDVAARRVTRAGQDHEDMVAVVGQLESGTVANHLVNWLSPLKERIIAVTGTKGCFTANTLTGDLTFFENGVASIEWETVASFQGVVQGDSTRYAIAKREPLVVELEAFRDAVLGKNSSIVSMEQAAETVRVAQAVLESLDKGGVSVGL